jgi:hypothetical protein
VINLYKNTIWLELISFVKNFTEAKRIDTDRASISINTMPFALFTVSLFIISSKIIHITYGKIANI